MDFPLKMSGGVGRRLSIRLRRIGIRNAWQFAQAPSPSVRAIGGVTLERTQQRELTGISLSGDGGSQFTPKEYLLLPFFWKAGYRLPGNGRSGGQLCHPCDPQNS